MYVFSCLAPCDGNDPLTQRHVACKLCSKFCTQHTSCRRSTMSGFNCNLKRERSELKRFFSEISQFRHPNLPRRNIENHCDCQILSYVMFVNANTACFLSQINHLLFCFSSSGFDYSPFHVGSWLHAVCSRQRGSTDTRAGQITAPSVRVHSCLPAFCFFFFFFKEQSWLVLVSIQTRHWWTR